MCLVSDKIKFCTCVSGSVDKLQHYWILYRFNKDKMDDYMGQPIIPASITDSNFIINESTLLIRINEPDAFDTPLKLSSKDRLEIVINNKAVDYLKRFTYTFEFKKGKWNAIVSDPFELMNHFEEDKFGKTKSALKRKTK
jgi:hypothetical protein